MKKGILVFGNPIIDSCAFVSDEFLKRHDLTKGGNMLLENDKIVEITSQLEWAHNEVGGSAMNVARWLGLLGYRTSVLGQYADDAKGSLVEQGFEECNVENKCIIKPGGITTNICICITPDAQRTMFGIFGASHEAYVKNVDEDVVEDFDAILLEGYTFATPVLLDITLPCVEKAHKTGKKSALVISGMFHVPTYKENLYKSIFKFTILTGTHEEFFALFDKSNIEDLLKYLESSSFELCAVTMGAEGSYVVYKGKSIFTPAPDVADVKDTTGAGDSFTAGLLYGYFNNWPIERTIKLANALAGYTITKIGIPINRSVKAQFDPILSEN